jgi:hypothetical protein
MGAFNATFMLTLWIVKYYPIRDSQMDLESKKQGWKLKSPKNYISWNLSYLLTELVQGEGFEPPKAEPDDLQSPVFDRFTIPAYSQYFKWSRQRDSNPRPAVYKTAALAN